MYKKNLLLYLIVFMYMYILFFRYESVAKELKNVLKVMVFLDSEKVDFFRDDLSKVEMIMFKKITGILSK